MEALTPLRRPKETFVDLLWFDVGCWCLKHPVATFVVQFIAAACASISPLVLVYGFGMGGAVLVSASMAAIVAIAFYTVFRSSKVAVRNQKLEIRVEFLQYLNNFEQGMKALFDSNARSVQADLERALEGKTEEASKLRCALLECDKARNSAVAEAEENKALISLLLKELSAAQARNESLPSVLPDEPQQPRPEIKDPHGAHQRAQGEDGHEGQ